ncbi:MAG: hypothetical protein WBZ39_03925 [Methylovirgula sp.]
MRVSMLFLLCAFFAAAALAKADPVPKLDVAKSCRDARDFGMSDAQQTFKSCMLDEQEAKDQLVKKWSQFKADARRSCVPDVPGPSYVEMLTCLEMTEQTLMPYSGGGAVAPASGAYRHDSPSPRPAPSPGPRGMRGL